MFSLFENVHFLIMSADFSCESVNLFEFLGNFQLDFLLSSGSSAIVLSIELESIC